MTDLDITAIRERRAALEEATRLFMSGHGPDGSLSSLIDATKNDVPPLLEEVDRLTAALESSRAVVERLQGELDAQTVEWEFTRTFDGRLFRRPKPCPWLPVSTDGAEN